MLPVTHHEDSLSLRGSLILVNRSSENKTHILQDVLHKENKPNTYIKCQSHALLEDSNQSSSQSYIK